MAKITIVLTDDLSEGNVNMTVDPPAQTLKIRVQEHGWQSLSPAEAIVCGIVAHVLETAGPTTTDRADLILPRQRLIT